MTDDLRETIVTHPITTCETVMCVVCCRTVLECRCPDARIDEAIEQLPTRVVYSNPPRRDRK